MDKYARRMTTMAESAAVVKGLFGSLNDPELISLGIGAPAKEALPVDILREISQDILHTDTRGIQALQYGPTAGLPDLQEVIAQQLLAPKGVNVSPDQIVITVGGMEGITLTCELFIEPGDVILVEKPTFIHAVETFEMFEAKCVGVEMDEDGMILEDLEDKIRKLHPKMIYVIPTFQNPSGRTLSLERRKRLAELAAQYDVLVLEDDPYRDIRYSGVELPPIRSFDNSGNVILCNSFSKIFSAGVRLGYLVANDAKMMDQLKNAKSAINSHSSMLPQILCAEFFKRGYFENHLTMLRNLYRERRDVMLECLEKHFPAGTKFTRPDGGLFTWAQLPGDMDTTALLQKSLTTPGVKVSYVAGEKSFVDGAPVKNCMRLSFGAVPPDKIRAATARLGKMLCEEYAKL